jgi:adenylate cyclase
MTADRSPSQAAGPGSPAAAVEAASLLERDAFRGGTRVAHQIPRGLSLSLPAINVVSAALTYIFVTYVVPLPGPAPPAAARGTELIAGAALTGVAWLVCEIWGRRTLAPVLRWLEQGRAPDARERARALRFPLHSAAHVFVVWSLAAVVLGLVDLVVGGSPAGGVLVTVMVFIGGLVASALSYLATEQIMRPAMALALASDPPTRPLVAGIGTRIYLAWEFGTAIAVGGVVVVAIAYLAGADMSPRRMAATVIFLGVLALTVGLVTLLIATRSIAGPVRTLRRAMGLVEAGDTDVTVTVDDGGEVGLLQAGFNRMVIGLRERDRVRDLFGRHVGEEVAQSALVREAEMGGELRHAAVLFVDVVGSTAFSAAHDPREVVATLNHFFGVVVEVVTLHGGWINKFEGDAALCVFGTPAKHPDASGAALAGARELQRRLRLELDGLEAAIGLSAGTVLAGNIGAAQRYEYTVIGDPVNEAARLTELAKSRPSRLLASAEIVRCASQGEARRWKIGEPVSLRGLLEPTRVAAPTYGGSEEP